MDTVSTRPRRPDDAGIVDQVVATMRSTPTMATYDRTLKALGEHLQSDDGGFKLLSDTSRPSSLAWNWRSVSATRNGAAPHLWRS